MALTWGQVKTWSSNSLSTYAGTVGSRRDTVVKQADALQARMSSFQGEGATAEALRRKMKTAHEALTTLADDLAEVQDAVNAAAGNVSDVESAVKKALSVASINGFTISDDGSVSCHIPYGTDGTGAIDAVIQNVKLLVLEAMALADYTDTSFHASLGSAGTDKSTSSASGAKTRMWSKEEQEKFRNMAPEERAKFWSEQSYEQKQYLADRYPELIGNADGVEAWARDRANRLNLNAKEARAKEDLARYTRELNEANHAIKAKAAREKIARVESDLAAYEKIRSTLANGISLEEYQHGKQGDPVSLLTLQDDGRRVKAAVAQGDVDHAKHVATFVPGIGTTVDGSLEMYFRETGNLRHAAAAQGNMPLKDVATVAWLGYDAPGEANVSNAGDIASPKLAQEGSDRLAGFLTGMHASRQFGAGDAHMTLVGHSYGSTTSGMAATKVKPGVIDDLALCGSPGMGTDDAHNYHVDQNHLWVSGVPQGDSVQGMGASGIGPVGHLGKNPMDADSGFTHLSDDATGSSKYNPNAPVSLPINWNFDNHSVYLDEGTETLQDFARVVAGVKR